VYFEITGPLSRTSPFQQTSRPAAFLISGLVLTAIALIIGGVLARRNIRQGRGDTRGALRIATCAFVLITMSTLVGMHHAWSIDEALLIISGLAMNLFWSATLWVAYVALEPSVRRRWPRLITSWARLIGGNWRDPLVGRDILIGLLFSVGIVAVVYVVNTIAQQLGWLTPRPLPVIPSLLQGSREQVAALLTTIPGGMIDGLTNLLLLLLFAIALRRFWIAVVALAAFQCVVVLFGAADFFNPVGAVAAAVLSTIPLVRFGLLAAVASRCFFVMTLHAPITFDVSVWYASFGLVLFMVYVALAAFGFYTSLAGRPVFGRALMDE